MPEDSSENAVPPLNALISHTSIFAIFVSRGGVRKQDHMLGLKDFTNATVPPSYVTEAEVKRLMYCRSVEQWTCRTAGTLCSCEQFSFITVDVTRKKILMLLLEVDKSNKTRC